MNRAQRERDVQVRELECELHRRPLERLQADREPPGGDDNAAPDEA